MGDVLGDALQGMLGISLRSVKWCYDALTGTDITITFLLVVPRGFMHLWGSS